MKYFGVDSNFVDHPNMRAVFRVGGHEYFSALVRTWGYVAQFGKYFDEENGPRIGWSLDSSGKPFAIDEMAEYAGVSVETFNKIMDLCADRNHIDAALWHESKVIRFEAMEKRADEYSQRLIRDFKARAEKGTLFDIGTGSGPTPDSVETLSGKKKRTEPKRKERSTTVPSDLFIRFWALYPKRDAKADAIKAWAQSGIDARPDAEAFFAETIAPAIQRAVRTDGWQRGFVPLPATWLRGRRWEDEHAVAPTAAPHAPRAPERPAGALAAAKGKYGDLTGGAHG